MLEATQLLADTYKSAIYRLVNHLDQRFDSAVDMMLRSTGQVIVCGMGKSGLFGQKISSTLASTGTPSIFLHPAEALHGDLGRVRSNDVLVLISNSGETEEIIRLLPAFERIGISSIAFTGNMSSSLARHCHVVLDISVDREACPLNLAPTTSGLTTLVMGDALAIALMEKRGFKVEDFAATHPGGALGKRLLTRVTDQMITEKLPFVDGDERMSSAIVTMTEGRLGIALVGTADRLEGIITDGDLRRAIGDQVDFQQVKARDLMSPSPLSIMPEAKMAEAEAKMQEARVQCLIVMDNQHHVCGVVQIFQPVT